MSDKAEKKPEATAGDKKDAGKDGHGEGAHGGKGGGIGALLKKTPVMLGGVMVIEAIVLFGGFKMFGGKPKTASGAEITAPAEEHGEASAEGTKTAEGEGHGDSHADAKPADEHGSGESEHGETSAPAAKPSSPGDKKKIVELEVLSFRAPNKLSGRTYLYDVSIYAVTRGDREKRVKETIDSRKALITDRIRTIIAQTDPEKLGGGSEPGLETLRRQVKYQLDQIVGEGLVDEVLVPRCIPFRTDY